MQDKPRSTIDNAMQNKNWTRHVFVKHGYPRWQQSQNMAKISKSYILTSPQPQGQFVIEVWGT